MLGVIQLGRGIDLLQDRDLEPGGRIQQQLANRVLTLCLPYIPKASGTLAGCGRVYGQGRQVGWDVPYARQVYYGKGINGQALVYHGGGSQGPFWVERMRHEWKGSFLQW